MVADAESLFSRQDIEAVRRGWAVATSVSKATSGAFYANLFRIAPETRGLFSEDMAAQERKLVATLNAIVDQLEDEGTLLESAEDLARRHVAYGVRAEDYDKVGEALICALESLLGEAFTEADRAAWQRVYGGLAARMVQAAYPGRG